MIWAMDHFPNDPPASPHTPSADPTWPQQAGVPGQTPPSLPTDPPAPGSGRRPDPGSPGSRTLAILCAVVFASLAILWQNLSYETQYRVIGETPPAAPDNVPAISTVSQVNILGRVYIRMNKMYEDMGMPMGPQAMGFIDQSILTTGDEIAAAIAAAELLEDADDAVDRLQWVRDEQQEHVADAQGRLESGSLTEIERQELEEESESRAKLLLDTKHLIAIYSGEGDMVSQDGRDRLIQRYAYFGRLATTHGLDDDDPARAELLEGGGAIVTVLLLLGLLILVVFLTGLVLLAVGAVGLASGRMKMAFEPPAPGGSVFIEVYALFVAGFLVMTVGTTIVSTINEPVAALVALLVQWSLLLVPFWPLMRGMKGSEFRRAIGLYRGRGLIREIWAGVLAYIASVPVFFFGVAMTFILMIVAEAIRMSMGADPAPLPENPVVDIVSQGDPVVLGLIFVLATVWAPLTEELVFRGALYRRLRSRLVWPVAAIIVGLLFAFMHSYGPLMVSPLIALGFMFSFMREWRGSIIACITAHFIHNFSVFCIAGLVIWLLA